MGYNNAIEIKQCYEDNINPIIPISKKNTKQKDTGKFTREKFIYNPTTDNYMCPNNQLLVKRLVPQIRENGRVNFKYSGASGVCKACPIKDKCLPTKTAYKTIFRWEHEEVIEKHNIKMQTEESKEIIKKRGSIVEHPFGTIKRTLGWDHFLVRGKEKVSGENALIMFAYNFKRLLNLIGTKLFQKLIIAMKSNDLDAIKKEIMAYIDSYLVNWRYICRIFDIYIFKEKNLSYI